MAVEVEVEVAVAVAFDNKKSNSTRAAEQAPLYKYEIAATCTNAPGSPPYQPSAVEKRFAGMTVDR